MEKRGVGGAEVGGFGIKGKEFRPDLLKILIDLTGMPDTGLAESVGTSIPL